MIKLDFQKDVAVDPDILDILWVKQPSLYMHYSEESARANDLVRRKKHELEVLDAKLDQKIRIRMEGEGKKTTEAGVKSMVIQDEERLKFLIEYNDAQYDADLYSSAVKAMEMKKVALQALVSLWAGSYFAGPSVPRNLGKEMRIQEEGTKKETDAVREAAGEKIVAEKSSEVIEPKRRERKNKEGMN